MAKPFSIFKNYPSTFWIANTIELFERAAWYGFYMLFANYLTSGTELGGLEFSQSQKGIIMGVGTGILYLLPILTGAIADRFGYRRMLTVAFSFYFSAFLLFPHFSSFAGVFAMYIYLAIGAALFKPIISATISKTTTSETSSVGFGIFYMMVNLGAFIGPLITMLYRGQTFYISAGLIALNFIMLLYYREPNRSQQNTPLIQSLKTIFYNIYTVIKDFRFMAFLLIVAGFWTMYFQLFMTLPVFIAQWVDSSSMYRFFMEYWPTIAQKYGQHGQMEAEFITNFDAFYIILFQVVISTLVMRMRPLNTMMMGFVVATVGMSLTVLTQNVWFTLAALLVFGIGEMSASPKITEYIGRIAPVEKKALFMGFTFIPVFLGNLLSIPVAGPFYERMADKYLLAQRFATEQGVDIPLELGQTKSFEYIANSLKLSPEQLTQTLWNHYHPGQFWMVIFGTGMVAALALWVYDRRLKAKS